MTCHGKKTIQDYIPRTFAISFGFFCGRAEEKSLKGLTYNISIYDQTNETKCTPIPYNPHNPCFWQYRHTTLPNLIGMKNFREASSFLAAVEHITVVLPKLIGSLMCHKYFQELVCYSVFPKCNRIDNTVIHPCKELCMEFEKACLSPIRKDILTSEENNTRLLLQLIRNVEVTSAPLDCDYLPSRHGSIPCFYKPVTCDAPSNVTNVQTSSKGATYRVNSKIEYPCNEGGSNLPGNNSIVCQYSGKWLRTSKCPNEGIVSLNPIIIVLPLFITSAVIYFGIIINFKWLKRSKNIRLMRNKEYDAFVCYDVADAQFTHKIIIKELEQKPNPPFKLCIHKRDFIPSYTIKWNIWNAIKNSNSAIIVMSQDFVDSMWCRDEFEGCYVENLEDPAFRLFVILMQPIQTLVITCPYMKSFLASKVCLPRDDPKLFRKIGKYLAFVKQRKKAKLSDVESKNGVEQVPKEIVEMFVSHV